MNKEQNNKNQKKKKVESSHKPASVSAGADSYIVNNLLAGWKYTVSVFGKHYKESEDYKGPELKDTVTTLCLREFY